MTSCLRPFFDLHSVRFSVEFEEICSLRPMALVLNVKFLSVEFEEICSLRTMALVLNVQFPSVRSSKLLTPIQQNILI